MSPRAVPPGEEAGETPARVRLGGVAERRAQAGRRRVGGGEGEGVPKGGKGAGEGREQRAWQGERRRAAELRAGGRPARRAGATPPAPRGPRALPGETHKDMRRGAERGSRTKTPGRTAARAAPTAPAPRRAGDGPARTPGRSARLRRRLPAGAGPGSPALSG